MNRTVASILWRAVVATGLLVALAAIVGRSVVPGVPTLTVVLYALAATSGVFVVVLGVTVASLQWRQVLLRRGATDPQWFWFAGEPAGLVRLRAEQRASTAADSGLPDRPH